MRTFIRGFGLAALIAVTTSCGDVARQGSSPVYLVIDVLQGLRGGTTVGQASNPLISAVITNVTTPAPCSTTAPCPTVFADSGQVTLRALLKDIGATVAFRADLQQRGHDQPDPCRITAAGRRQQHPGRRCAVSGSIQRHHRHDYPQARRYSSGSSSSASSPRRRRR